MFKKLFMIMIDSISNPIYSAHKYAKYFALSHSLTLSVIIIVVCNTVYGVMVAIFDGFDIFLFYMYVCLEVVDRIRFLIIRYKNQRQTNQSTLSGFRGKLQIFLVVVMDELSAYQLYITYGLCYGWRKHI